METGKKWTGRKDNKYIGIKEFEDWTWFIHRAKACRGAWKIYIQAIRRVKKYKLNLGGRTFWLNWWMHARFHNLVSNILYDNGRSLASSMLCSNDSLLGNLDEWCSTRIGYSPIGSVRWPEPREIASESII